MMNLRHFPLLLSLAALAGSVAADGLSDSVNPADNAMPAGAESVGPLDRAPAGLTADLVYNLLVGEIASQRGEPWMAFAHYLRAAELASDPGLAELATRSALAANDIGAADQAVRLWLRLAPEALSAHLIAAHVAVLWGEQERALAHLQQVVRLAGLAGQEGFLQVVGLIATIEPLLHRMELMRALVAEDPENPSAHYALAMVAADARDYTAAIAAVRRTIELDPDWDRPRTLLVRLLLGVGQRAEARSELEAFVHRMPDGDAMRMLYAQLLVEEREFSDARNVFERMLQNAPKEPDVLFAIGILSLQLEDLEAARTYFERLHATGQRRDDAAFYLGQIEESLGEPAKALAWYGKVGGDNAVDAQMRIARIHALDGHLDEARAILRRLRDAAPEHSAPLFLTEAELLREQGETELAMALLDEALEAHPGDEELLYTRAIHGVKQGRIDWLERDLRAILEANPDHADALNALGYTLADQTDRFQEAYGYIERALAIRPDDPAFLDSMGWVLFRLGRYPEALEYLQRAYEMMPDGEIAAHLGETLWVLGRRDAAWRIWDEAIAAEPDNEVLLRVIDHFRHSRRTPGR